MVNYCDQELRFLGLAKSLYYLLTFFFRGNREGNRNESFTFRELNIDKINITSTTVCNNIFIMEIESQRPLHTLPSSRR